jgi:hypothetical protein
VTTGSRRAQGPPGRIQRGSAAGRSPDDEQARPAAVGAPARARRDTQARPGAQTTRGARTRPGTQAGPGPRARPRAQARPGTRAGPGTQVRPRRLGSPASRPGRPGTGRPPPESGVQAAPGATISRTPFVFLVVGLLGGGLLCLLLINTILDTGSFQITRLQQENVTLAQQTQALQAQIAAEESPSLLAKRARQLGMSEPGLFHFLDLAKGRIENQPGHERDVRLAVPGYSP